MGEKIRNNLFQNEKIIVRLLSVFVFIAFSQILNGQVKFYKSFQSDGITSGQKIIQNDGYLIMTNARNEIDDTYDIILIKTDLSGDSIWSKQYDFYGELEGRDFIKVDETGYMILGRHMKEDWHTDIALIRINNNGDTLWTNLSDHSNYDNPEAIVQTDDGGFVITGHFYPEEENADIFLMKSNSDGEFLWLRSFGDSLYDVGKDVIKDDDGGFLITGNYRVSENFDNAFLLKTNAGGDSVWMKRYFTSTGSTSRSLIRTGDDGLMILGGINNKSIIKTDDLGDTLWTRQYNISSSASGYFYSIIQTEDDGYLIGGVIDIKSSQPSSSNMAIVKLDSLGNLEWYRKYATNVPYNKQVRDIIEAENGYVILGYTGLSLFTLDNKMYLIRTDKNGCYIQDPVITGVDFFCAGDSTTLHATPGFDSFMWSTGAVSESAFISLPGKYAVQVIDSNDCPLWSDTTTVKEQPLPLINIDPDGSTIFCDGDVVNLVAHIANDDPLKEYSFTWNNDLSSGDEIQIHLPGTYSVFVEDNFGCSSSDSIEIIVRYPYQDERICIVTIDLLTGKNLIIWEKTADKGTEFYNIYREDILIGTIGFDDLSIFTDTVVDPEKRPYLYQLSVVDTCGNVSELSPYHKPLFLQYVSSAGGVNLEWDEYEIEGEEITFASYAVYRGSDSSALSSLEENIPTAVNVYTDNDPNALERKYYYRVAGILTDPCYPTGAAGRKADSGPYSHSMSNIEDNRLQEIPYGVLPFTENEFKIIPNPFKETATLMFNNPEKQSYTLYIMDLSGKVCRIIDNITSSEYVLEKGDLMEGFYFVELRGPTIYRGKIVVE